MSAFGITAPIDGHRRTKTHTLIMSTHRHIVSYFIELSQTQFKNSFISISNLI